MPTTMPAERAVIRRALPNFLNFMRFLHPGQAKAAKCADSAAELGWDGSHCIVKGEGLLCLVSAQDRPKEGLGSWIATGKRGVIEHVALEPKRCRYPMRVGRENGSNVNQKRIDTFPGTKG